MNRKTLLGLWLAYVLIIVLGSWAPFQFTRMPMGEALARYQGVWHTFSWTAGPKSDLLVNVLIGVPLAGLLMAALEARERGRSGLWLMGWVLAVCMLISHGLEFGQLFLPQRTASSRDVITQWIGAVIGLGLWQLLRTWRFPLTEKAGQNKSGPAIARSLFWLYLVGVLIYGLRPFDFSSSPVDLYHKFKNGHVIIALGLSGFLDVPNFLYQMGTEMAIWAMLSLLAIWAYRKSILAAVSLSVLMSAAIEGMQLFLVSRYTDIHDVLAALIGSIIGATVVGRRAGVVFSTARERRVCMVITAVAVWVGLLAIVYWAPFDFRFNSAFLKGRWNHQMMGLFFSGAGMKVITASIVISALKSLSFVPLGMMLGWGLKYVHLHHGRFPVSLMVLIVVSTVIDAGQLFMPSQAPSLSCWLFAIIGGILGWLIVVLRKQRPVFLSGVS